VGDVVACDVIGDEVVNAVVADMAWDVTFVGVAPCGFEVAVVLEHTDVGDKALNAVDEDAVADVRFLF
jgi:hypothetical protein